MIHRGDSGVGARKSPGISRRQQAIRAAIPRNLKGRPANRRMAQLTDLLTSSVIEPETLTFIEAEVQQYLKLWNKHQQYLRFQAGADHLQQEAGPAPEPYSRRP